MLSLCQKLQSEHPEHFSQLHLLSQPAGIKEHQFAHISTSLHAEHVLHPGNEHVRDQASLSHQEGQTHQKDITRQILSSSIPFHVRIWNNNQPRLLDFQKKVIFLTTRDKRWSKLEL